MRTHLINELVEGDLVTVAGWICEKRDHGGLIFFELRDSSGIVQLVSDNQPINLSIESVVTVSGTVRKRSEAHINPNKHLGHIEIYIDQIEVLSYCTHLPFTPKTDVNDELKQKYRYINLRDKRYIEPVLKKAEIIKEIRSFMHQKHFVEIDTPILTASSPEGARDFVVPSRLHPGKFYALPQAPQIYKQLLMASGVDKYFQIARCFRDEDARKDRNYGEFQQLDLEISFSNQEQVLNLLKDLMTYILKKFSVHNTEFTYITYEEALTNYGTDKPNLNNPLRLIDLTELFVDSEMKLFSKAIAEGSIVKGVKLSTKENPNKTLEYLWEQHQFRASYVTKVEGQLKGPIAKFVPVEIVKEKETMFFVCDKWEEACTKAGIIIKYFEPEEDLINHVVFVADFPMFEYHKGQWTFKHNPFSMPDTDHIDTDNLGSIKAHQYDMVLNGYELASGSVRNHKVDLLKECLHICGLSEHVLIRAFQSGVPPHAGAAIGIDRLAMLLTGTANTRDVNAFSLNTNGYDSLMGSPSDIDPLLKKELHIS